MKVLQGGIQCLQKKKLTWRAQNISRSSRTMEQETRPAKNQALCANDAILVDLLQRRFAARTAKDYPAADKLRDELVATFAVDLNDRANTWKDANGRCVCI